MTNRARRRLATVGILALAAALALETAGSPAQTPQNPSPMVEHTRAHPRLKQAEPPGRREQLELGKLYVPERLAGKKHLPLVVHFHGGLWLPEVAAARDGRTAVLSIQVGAGSRVYEAALEDPARFGRLLAEAESRLSVRFDRLRLSAWSAGYGAVRAILKVPDYYRRVESVLLLDGLHAAYIDGKPGPQESKLQADGLQVFVTFARDAAAGRKRMIITHTEIFPGTFASTTETADYLLGQLGMKRRPVLRWGPMGTQQLSEARRGRFLLLGYAGNSAPDHVDQLHGLPQWLQLLR